MEQDTDAQLSLWINGAQRDGDPIQAMALIRFGYDLTGQQDDPAAGTIVWTSDPTGYFTNAANANTWARFTSGTFTPTSDTISVWLWVEGGDSPDGVRAYFDDLSLITEDVPPPASVQETWEVYR